MARCKETRDEALERLVWDCVNNGGADEECGSVTECGRWYGIVRTRRRAYIVSENSQGFRNCETFRRHEEAEEKWSEILADQKEIDGPRDDDWIIEENGDGAEIWPYVECGIARPDKDSISVSDSRLALIAIIERNEENQYFPDAWYAEERGGARLVRAEEWEKARKAHELWQEALGAFQESGEGLEPGMFPLLDDFLNSMATMANDVTDAGDEKTIDQMVKKARDFAADLEYTIERLQEAADALNSAADTLDSIP